MVLLTHLVALAFAALTCATTCTAPTVIDTQKRITYRGLRRNGLDVFLNIPYGQDTGGLNRFKPPRPKILPPGSVVDASANGPACPQALGGWVVPLSLSNVTAISEDCLHLNVVRPKGTPAQAGLPVMVFIHGGSFWTGQNQEITISPNGMILESIENGKPAIHVAMNYRLGLFGFAQSDALRAEVSENAGLRDQRLAIEWVRDNIKHFGGDPRRITIFGQSSGGLSVGLQIMAYGAKKPVPFQQGICQSQALEPGITGNFTIDAMKAVVDYVDCNSTSLHSQETVDCLRSLDLDKLLNASLTTYKNDIAHNIGDIWLPSVDGDFLPDAPSRLIRDGHFANVTTMMGWCEDDVTFFTDTNITTAEDARRFLSSYVPGLREQDIDSLLALYPPDEFEERQAIGLSGQFFRTARIFRDIIMTCPPIWYSKYLSSKGNSAYLYDWNQTILDPILTQTTNRSGFGPIHTSEFAYIFGNLSHYNTSGYPFHPTPSDYDLKLRGSRSWTTFAASGKPGMKDAHTFQGVRPAYSMDNSTYLFVMGGPYEGASALRGPDSHDSIARQKLVERCSFINSPGIIERLGF
ncbi:hypothetical protein HIM_05362 [Hirsutella minnesotensis 3608]|uniref:Carboxylic ester hydrolase n=1 Tax=Hirsutella minnesotensis 3608 TaxID=1043627 RepID=A0A0F7ZUN4_9HYPO|nr:hypothetical protein HIM_05362 [Hirsutella minnesotensis 3608]